MIRDGITYKELANGRLKAMFTAAGSKVKHGRDSSYKHYACRCNPCTQAHREKITAQRAHRATV